MDVTISCQCPGNHGTDTVTLFDRLDFHRATTVTKAVSFIDNDDPATRPAEVLATLSEYYVLMGVRSWSIVGADSKKLPVSTANVRRQLLEHPEVGVIVDAADELYQEQILLPLLARASSSSPRSRTAASTSRTPRGATRPPKPSKRSSITTIPTDATDVTSSALDIDSSSSQKTESAA